MIFTDGHGLRHTVKVDVADQNDALHTCRNRALQRLPHEDGMQIEAVERDTDGIEDRVDIRGCRLDRFRLIRIPSHDLR